MEYQILFNPKINNKPYISLGEETDYWHLNELNSCDTEYILNDVLPNIKKIWSGEKYWDEYRSPTYGAFDTYEFGYDATLIDFGKEKSIISYGFGDGEIEVPSEEIYTLMKEWGEHLKKWKNETA
jgi:hypothetical protein